MMSYTNTENEERTVDAGALPEPTMADIMKETRAMAGCVLETARRINGFLMANTARDERGADKAGCFREELLNTRYDLFLLNNELTELASALGVE